MTMYNLVAKNVSNTEDALDNIKDTLVSMGWTLHDDLSGGSPYAYVMKSTGESGNEPPVYFRIYKGSNLIYSYKYLYWDNATHTGYTQIGSTQASLKSDDSTPFVLWVYGDKDGFTLITYVSSVYDAVAMMLIKPFSTTRGEIQSGVSSGSSVVLTLGSGEADDFVAGTTYQMVGVNGEGRENCVVSSVNSGSNQVTIASLALSYSAGAVIGWFPWRWITFTPNLSYAYMLTTYLSGGAGTEGAYGSKIGLCEEVNNYEDTRFHGYVVKPLIFFSTYTSASYAILGLSYKLIYPVNFGNSHEDTAAPDSLESGTSSGSNTVSTFNDTAQSWSTDVWAGKVLIITGGLGAGQMRKISSNTSTQIVPTVNFETVPDGTSTYVIATNGYRYFYFGNVNYACLFKEC